MVGCKKFWSTSGEKDKFPPIQLEAGQIWTFPTEPVEICLLHERWIKTFDTQPFGQLYIKYGLVF